jgi:hypothetical protein
MAQQNKRKHHGDCAFESKRVKHEKSNNNSIVIPQEVWFEIFQYIPYTHLIINLSLVNQYFYNMILKEGTTLWKLVCENQLVLFNIKTRLAEKFVTTHRITSIHFHSKDFDIKRYLENDLLLDTMKLIEPFVTHLKIPSKQMLSYFYAKVQRRIFPHLTILDLKLSLLELKNWFGTNLSQFKQLSICSNIYSTKNIQFGSLENLTLESCGEFERDILELNAKTLKYVQFTDIKDNFKSEYLKCIAPTLKHLTLINISHNSLNLAEFSNPIVFSKLRFLEIVANTQFVYQFFSVMHPLLTEVIVNEYESQIGAYKRPVVAIQPTIRYFKYSGETELVRTLVDRTIVEKFTYFRPFAGQETIDLPLFIHLRSLTLFSFEKRYSNLVQIFQQTALSSLRLYRQFNIILYLPYLQNLYNLNVDKIDDQALYEVMKLPRLKRLTVNEMEMSFARFSRIAHEASSVTDIVIENFKQVISENDPVYIIAPLETLIIQRLTLSTQYSIEIKWVLMLAAAMNVTIFSNKLEYTSSSYHKLYAIFNEHPSLLMDTLYEVIDRNYLKVSDLERTKIVTCFEFILKRNGL